MFRRAADPRARELRELEPFSACTTRQLEEITKLTDDVMLPEGKVLIQEGRSGRECFVIADGEAAVLIGGEEVARLGRGDIVGEMAVVDHEPRSATVVAETPLRAVVMTSLAFVAIAESCPPVARRVMKTLAQRLRDVQAA